MQEVVKLSEIAETMELQSDEISAFLNRKSGKIEMINIELLRAIEDNEDPLETIELIGGDEEDISLAHHILQGDTWLSLPSKFDVHDYEIVKDFCRSQQDTALQNLLFNAIQGSGAFRRFRAAIEKAGLLEKWYTFKNEAYRNIARQWCEENKIEFKEV